MCSRVSRLSYGVLVNCGDQGRIRRTYFAGNCVWHEPVPFLELTDSPQCSVGLEEIVFGTPDLGENRLSQLTNNKVFNSVPEPKVRLIELMRLLGKTAFRHEFG